MGRFSFRHTRLILLLCAMLTVALMSYAIQGTASRFMADDYCFATVSQTHTYWDAQVYWYTRWFGRFSFTALITLADWAGPVLAPLFPAVGLALWASGVYVTLAQAAKAIPVLREPGYRFLLTLLAIGGTLFGAPHLVESLYWRTAMLMYLVPLALMGYLGALLLYLASQGRSLTLGVPAVLLFALFAGGFSEVTASLQFATLSLGALVCCLLLRGAKRKRMMILLAAGLIGSGSAMAIIAVAPGNAVRQEMLHRIESPARWLELTFKYSAVFVLRSLVQEPLVYVLAITAPLFLTVNGAAVGQDARRVRSLGVKFIAGLPIMGFLLVMAAFAPGIFAMSKGPPGRALIAPQHVAVWTALGWGLAAGKVWAASRALPVDRSTWLSEGTLRRVLALGVAGMVLYLAVASVVSAASQAERAAAFAAGWDAQDREIRALMASGAVDLVVSEVPVYPGENLDNRLAVDSDYWVNGCVADYYGVNSIAVR